MLQEFLDGFEGRNGNRDGIITLDEFEDYYAEVSASIDTDDYFALMMCQAWHMTEN